VNLAADAIELFFALCALGALAACVLPDRIGAGVLALIGSLASLALLVGGADGLIGGASFRTPLWSVLSLGTMTLTLDRVSSLFLLITGMVFLPVSIFSRSYLRKFIGHHSLRYFGLLYHALFAAVVLVLIAGDVIAFLVAWELMSIASYVLVNYEDEHEESSQAAFVMLAMSELGMVAVVIAFILLANAAGSTDFGAIRAARLNLAGAFGWAIFLLSFGGFAVKAGLVPLSSWLPLAHPVAPTNVSALLSAVIVNLGIYGILRTNLDIAPIAGPGPGLVVLVVGSLSALIGILYATTQAEMKRLLAHSTIENMGIVAAGLGAAMIFLTSERPVLAGIALVAALYHLANHSAYKALLFIGTGAVEAAAGSRDLDKLGGLARGMPWTSALVLIGVLGIAALPPLNGFVSEWLTLQSILRSAMLAATAVKVVFAICGALLALTAGLAVTCFVKFYAMGFLGMPRSDGARDAAEGRLAVRTPLLLLAVCCIGLGVLPTYVIPALDSAGSTIVHQSAAAALVPPFLDPESQAREQTPSDFLADFHKLGADLGRGLVPGRGLVVLHRGGAANPVVFAMSTTYLLAALAAIIALVILVFRLATLRRQLTRGAVWAGGLKTLRPETTYTATGFSNPVRVIFHAILRPASAEESTEAVANHFRTAIRRTLVDVPIVDRLVLGPPVRALGRVAAIVRRMHVGNVNAYAGYVLVTLLVVLIIGTLIS
jgi:hydrogenase-4 component B